MAMDDANNPIGIKQIDHLEFTCEDPSHLQSMFYKLGFQRTFEAENKVVFNQAQSNFLINCNKDPSTQSRRYFETHGEGVCKMSFEVFNCEKAIETAVKRGAKCVVDLKTVENEHGQYKTAAIQGFGDVINEFVERPKKVFRPNYKEIENDSAATPLQTRTTRIDHLTNNVPKGEMDHWVQFYKDVYGFKETRYFDIKGKSTGLYSKVVQLENSAVIIPINEPEKEGGKSQIQEFLDLHKGAGVQHIALTTPNILSTVGELQQRGIKFLEIPDTYYEMLPDREFNVTENIQDLQKLSLLADGDKEGYLLQIFTNTMVGPLFFEYIQRKNHWGFGEGNFQALFDSIELDQKRRGYI